MNPTNTRLSFFSANFHTMGTLPLFVLLLFVQSLLRATFACTSDVVMNRVYGITFLVLPLVLLFILGLILRTRRSAALLTTKNCSFCYFFYVMGQAGKAPLIWFLLFLIDGHYIICLAALYGPYDYADLKATLQIFGLVGLVLFLALDYAIPQSTWAKKLFSYCVRQRQEDLILQEVEIVLQQKVEEKRKAFLEEMVHTDLDQLKSEELWDTSDLVWKYKEMALKRWAEKNAGGPQELETLH